MATNWLAACLLCAYATQSVCVYGLSSKNDINSIEPVPCKNLLNMVWDPPSRVNLLQVGACDGDFEDDTSNDPIQPKLKKRPNIHATLIEPNPQNFATLQKHIDKTFGGNGRINALNVALSPKPGDLTFYVPNHKFFVEYPNAPHFAKYQLGTLDKESIITGLAPITRPKNATDFVESFQIQGMTPKQVLDWMNLKARDLDILHIDAEGLDAVILDMFLKVRNFQPKIIVFESKVVHFLHDQQLQNVLHVLEKKRYKTNCLNGTCPINVFAWKFKGTGIYPEPEYCHGPDRID